MDFGNGVVKIKFEIMKTVYILMLCALFTVSDVLAQSNNLVVYTNEPLPFYLILNGVRQNNDPQTNVKVVGLEEAFYRFRVVFANGQVKDIDKSFSFLEKNEEMSFEVVRKKKKFAVRYAGSSKIPASMDQQISHATPNQAPDMPQAPVRPVGSGDVNTMPTAPTQPVGNGNPTGMQTGGTVNVHAHETPSTSTQSTTVTNGAAGGNISINVSETGFNMNVNVNDPNGVGNSTTTTTTTTTGSSSHPSGVQLNQNMTITESSTTTTTSSSHNTSINTGTSGNMGSNQDDGTSRPNTPHPTRPVVPQPIGSADAAYVKGYSGRVGCNVKPLMNVDHVKKSALNESFSDGKFAVVEHALHQNCMTVEQVISLSEVFTFEDDKIKFVEMAYEATYDIDNYFNIRTIFTFSASKEEFDDFVKSKR